MRSRILLIVLLAIVMFTGCSDLTEEEILEKTHEKIKEINTYQCMVKVEVIGNKDSQLYEIRQAYKDGSFRLETMSPKHLEGKVVIIKNNKAKIFHPHLEKSIIIDNFTENREECMFLGDFITWDFQEVMEVEENSEQDQDYLILSREIDQKNFYHYNQSLWIEKGTFMPRYIKIYDKEGNTRIEISILDLKINEDLENELFKFD